jgi:hypothetical protein
MTLLEKLRSRWRGLGRIVLYTSLLLPGAAGGAYEEYFQAIRMDNVYFKQLMQRGMGPNLIEPKRGYTGLMLSIREDSMKAFEVLVNAPDVNLEAQATNGDTPLMLAAFYGNAPVVKLLLARGGGQSPRLDGIALCGHQWQLGDRQAAAGCLGLRGCRIARRQDDAGDAGRHARAGGGSRGVA